MLACVAVQLRHGDNVATVVPAAGGRLGSLVVDGTELIVTGDPDDVSMQWGSFPMAPYAGRVRKGRFVHDGTEHRLPITLPPHAAHGTVYDRRWERTDLGDDPAVVALACPLGDRWPLGGTAAQRIELGDGMLECRLRVTAGHDSMPAEIGWHPWFRTPGPVELRATAMYERADDHLPTGRLVDVRPPPWDDCFIITGAPRFPVGALVVSVESDCDHVVVFDGLDIGIAVEPQSGPPDAFHLAPRVLAPGESLERTMTIRWSAA
jgi:aldose 1-epimerase